VIILPQTIQRDSMEKAEFVRALNGLKPL